MPDICDNKIRVEELKVNGKSLFDRWFRKLAKIQQFSIDARLDRVRKGNLGSHRNLKLGIVELKFDSGLRIYGGFEGETLFLLILGGSKFRQDADIKRAEEVWLAYTKEKSEK